MMASTLARLPYTPLGDLLRGSVTGRLDWRASIDAANLAPEVKSLLKRVVGGTRLSRIEKANVAADLLAHFTDGLAAGSTGAQLIDAFGETRRAARLIRRSKIRGQRVAWYFFRGAFWLVMALLVSYTGLAIYYYAGSASPRVNYIAQLNGRMEQTPAVQRAWPIYQSVLQTLRGSQWDPVLNYSADGKHWPQIAGWIDAHEAALDSLRKATDLPVLGVDLGGASSAGHFAVGMIGSVALPELRNLRVLGDLLAFDCKHAREQGDGARLERDINALVNLAAQQRYSGELCISELVGLALLNQSYDQLDRTLVETPRLLDDSASIRLAHRISIPRTGSDLISLRGEGLLFYDTLQRTFTDDGHGDGHLVPVGWNFYRAKLTQSFCPFEQLLAQPAAGSVLQPASLLVMDSRRELLDEYQRIMDLNLAMIRIPLREADANAAYEEQKALTSSAAQRLRYAPLLSLFPLLQRSAELAERTLGQRDGLLIGLALELYHRRSGHYPQTLAQLTPGLLPEVIADRITGDPLKYRLIDGKPLIYSVGIDRIDDGGRLPVENGQPSPSAAAQWGASARNVSGDWVLYPKPRISWVAQMEN